MMKKIYFTLLLSGTVFQGINLLGQTSGQQRIDSIVQTALKDELYRNLNSLSDKDAGKPFFISYTYLDGQETEASAILGVLENSDQSKVNDYDMRLMMGNYTLNDENFEDNYSNNNSRSNSINRRLPVEPDYWGIRNAFWWNTSALFRSASNGYTNKLAALKDKPITAEEDQLPDYTQAEPVKLRQPGSIVSINKQDVEMLVKNVSSVFKEYKDVFYSGVSAYVFSSTVYVVNSEGSEIRIPLNIAVVDIYANIYADKGEILTNSISFTAPLFAGLPNADTIKNASRKLADYLLALKKAEIIQDNYTGPVLFENDGVADLFSSCLLGYDNPLVAERETLVNSISKSMTSKNKTTRESKLGKKLISKDITVKSLPHLKEYKGIPLMGAFDIDAECIVPPDELTLIDKGILKNMLCDRIPTKNFKQSNGHNRIGLGYGGVTKELMPGVLMIESDKKVPMAQLKQQIIDLAIDKGLEYVIIVKPLINAPCLSPLCFYKLDVNTKEEKLIYHMSFSDYDIKTLNKIVACGDGTYVQNVVSNGGNMDNSTGRYGFAMSFIVPDALLIDEMELAPEFPDSDSDLPFYNDSNSEGQDVD